MKKVFGISENGKIAHLYTITAGGIRAVLSDHGATLVKLFVPDREGKLADVVLGFDEPASYTASGTYFGATIGRNSNRVGGAAFALNGESFPLEKNDGGKNNLHSGFAPYKNRLWQVERHEENTICFYLHSPHGDQGFPGNADIRVTYSLDGRGGLHICYDGICDRDTVFNMTNHTYFNLAGHEQVDAAMGQVLTIHADSFTPADGESIPTGEIRPVAGTPMDFRVPKVIGRDINMDYDALKLQNGYDHNWILNGSFAARLEDPISGRVMEVYTDCPGVQFYAGNFIGKELGKGGITYCNRSGICLETQYYPDSVNHPQWPQPFTKAGETYHSETLFRFI